MIDRWIDRWLEKERESVEREEERKKNRIFLVNKRILDHCRMVFRSKVRYVK